MESVERPALSLVSNLERKKRAGLSKRKHIRMKEKEGGDGFVGGCKGGVQRSV